MTEMISMKMIIPLIFLAFCLGAYQFALRLPYHFYQEAMSTGIDSSFLSLRKLPKKLYQGARYQFQKMDGVSVEDPRLWESLHFSDYKLPFPIKHPSFRVVPLIERREGKYFFGYKIVNYRNKEINRVIFHTPERFTLELHRDKIFGLPLFRQQIMDQGLKNVWRDLFLENYFLSPYLFTPPVGAMWSPWELPLTEMVYDLFILSSRERFFSLKTKSIFFWEERNMGIIEVIDKESIDGKSKQYREELVYYLEKDTVYKIEVRTLLEDFPAEKYRQKLLKTISVKDSHQDSSTHLYAAFQKLKYADKMTPSGLVYLYAGLTHKPTSKPFLREMIQFLERGKNDSVFLEPLYTYGYDLYGTNFSNYLNKRKETANEKLKRVMKEEEDKELKRILGSEVHDVSEEFDSSEKKIQFFLQRAKDEGEDSDLDSKSLIID